MRNSVKTIIILIAIVVACTACEYELSGEFNRDISTPEASHQGDITLSFDNDSVIIYETTQVNYSVNSFGLNCNNIEIEYLDTKFTDSFNSASSFMLTPDFSKNGWFDLTAKFYLSTGTGSVADRFKAENYVGTKTWKIKFVKLSGLNVELKQHLNKDSLVELYWIKPKYISIKKATMNGLDATSTNGDTTFYAIENYCGGWDDYGLSVELAGGEYLNSSVILDYKLPELNCEQDGPDSCRLYWKSNIRLNYILTTMSSPDLLVTKKTYTSHKLKLPFFGWDIQFEVYFMPYSITDPRKAVIQRKLIRFYPGIKFPYATYCPGKDQFMVIGWSGYQSFSFPLSDFSYVAAGGGTGHSNYSGSLLLIAGTGDFAMYRNGQPNPGSVITGANWLVALKNVQLVDNDCVGFSYTNLTIPIYKLINLGNDLSWKELSFTPDFVNTTTNKYLSALALTQSGKYLCSRGATDFIIYDLSDHQTPKIIFSTPKDNFLSVINNPNQPNQVIVTTKTGFELRNCPGFELAGSFVDPENSGVVPMNVDIYSNILLGWSSKHYHLYNLSTMKEIFRLNGPDTDYNNSAMLSRNYIFNAGRAMDLTNYLK